MMNGDAEDEFALQSAWGNCCLLGARIYDATSRGKRLLRHLVPLLQKGLVVVHHPKSACLLIEQYDLLWPIASYSVPSTAVALFL